SRLRSPVGGGVEPRRTYGSSGSLVVSSQSGSKLSARQTLRSHDDVAVQVGASMFEGATKPRGSVWSARSLLPLWRVPRRHALWNWQNWKAVLFQVQCQ